jgi:hypothetical protein
MPYRILILSMSGRMIAEPSRPAAGAGVEPAGILTNHPSMTGHDRRSTDKDHTWVSIQCR